VLELHEGGDLILRTTPGRGQNIQSVIALHPSAEKWRTFRTSLDTLNVWSWKAEYVDTAAPTDGCSCQVELTYPDRKLVSHGYEAAPTHDGSWSPMKGLSSGSDSTLFRFYEGGIGPHRSAVRVKLQRDGLSAFNGYFHCSIGPGYGGSGLHQFLTMKWSDRIAQGFKPG
jgi:hypothetical protein